MDIIQIKGLTKRYKRVEAISDVTFSVPERSIYGLIGLNGAGKTTTIKSVIGLLKDFSGDISINGTPWGVPEYNRHFAFLPELFTPHNYLKGMEYITFMQKLHGGSVDTDKVLKLCDDIGFDRGLLNRKTNTYSKGTMQKLGIIQSVCTPTKVLIFDEPMSGLDPLARAQFRKVLLDVNNEGRTIFLSTHILNDIDALCTNVGILNKGKLLFSGTPQELKTKNSASNMEEAFLKEIAR